MKTRALIALLFAAAACGGGTKSTAPVEPERGPVQVTTDTEIELLDPIRFVPEIADVTPESLPTIDNVASTMIGNPSIKLVEVQVRVAEEMGGETSRQEMATRRAKTVYDLLVARNVDAGRLTYRGLTEVAPPGKDEVLFQIQKRDNFD